MKDLDRKARNRRIADGLVNVFLLASTGFALYQLGGLAFAIIKAASE